MGRGGTFTKCVNMGVRKYSEQGAFFSVRLRSEQYVLGDSDFFLAFQLSGNFLDKHVRVPVLLISF